MASNNIFRPNPQYSLKIWWFCDSDRPTSYPLNGQVYLGKQPGESKEVVQVAQVVHDLVSPWLKSGRNVVADNFFSSVQLVDELLQDGLTYAGKLRSNKPHIPAEMRPSSSR